MRLFTPPRLFFVVLQKVCVVCQEAGSTGPVYGETVPAHLALGHLAYCEGLENTGLLYQYSSRVFNTSPFSVTGGSMIC